MIREAVYSDGTSEYCYPTEPNTGDRVTVVLRVAHSVNLEIYMVTESDGSLLMTHDRTDDVFDYYSTSFTMPGHRVYYYFQIKGQNECFYYDRVGVCDGVRREYSFSITPDFSTPDWAKGAVMYQILVDRFANGDESNDVVDNEYFYINTYAKKVPWDENPSTFDVCRFHGGDLEGVRQKLYYLKSLGVEVIYFNPLFVSPSNHKYDIADYDYIDPHYGKIIYDGGESLNEGDHNNANATRYKRRATDIANLKASNAFFAQFVEEAHRKGIRVILDGVFNHCGSFNKWLDRENIYDKSFGYPDGAFKSKNSPYNDYFFFNNTDDNAWPNNTSYDSWWGNDTLPKLNYEGSESLYNYILEIGKKWVSPPYNCDGWRLDVAADLGHSVEFNHKFWADFRKAVKSANPDAIVLAEHYGDPSDWLRGDQWDTVMNYDAFMEPFSAFLTGMEKHSDSFDPWAVGDGERFRDTMLHFMARLNTSSLYCAMNQLSNHDHSRFLTRTNHKAGRVAELGSNAAAEGVSIPIMKLAVMMQMTWPGAPTLYYGDEAGVVGFTDPDSRRVYPWGHADYDLIDFHRDIIGIHKSSSALKKGSFKFLNCGRGYISYGRFNSLEKMVVAINVSDHDIALDIPVWLLGIPMNGQVEQIMISRINGYSIMHIKREVKDGILHVELESTTGIIFSYER